MHHGFEDILDADALLGADQNRVLRRKADQLLDLFANSLRLSRRQIDFVDDRNDFQVVVSAR